MTLQAQFRRWPLGAGAIMVALLGVAWCVAQDLRIAPEDGPPTAIPRYESRATPRSVQSYPPGQELPGQYRDDRSIRAGELTNPNVRVRTRARVVSEQYVEEMPVEELQRRNRWRELANQIRQTEAAEERQVLGEELKGVLSEIFDEDIKQREASLAELEQRVAKLRESLDGRKTNRDRIIGLQLDSVLLEAEGLSFPGTPPHGQELGGWRNERAGQAGWATPWEPGGRAVPLEAAPEDLPRPTLTVH